jgi:DNA-binding transcriptional MerR regulator
VENNYNIKGGIRVEEVRYMISEAAKRVEVEPHVLRYWQGELDLPISRNEMEQRYYRETDIELFKRIKQLKEQGFQLKAIKMILSNVGPANTLDSDLIPQKEIQEDKIAELFHQDKPIMEGTEGTSLITKEDPHEIKEDTGSKMSQFKTMMNQIILTALKENNGILSEEISLNVSDGVIREMSYLMRLQEEREEERFRKFDVTLRDYQKSRLMTAATSDKKRKKSKFLKKNRIYI